MVNVLACRMHENSFEKEVPRFGQHSLILKFAAHIYTPLLEKSLGCEFPLCDGLLTVLHKYNV
uniref:Uncharacterized protein n=1 Tax=Arundo donax TaxID=35708 RepID=A0A0A9CJS2_ARUDO